MLQKGDISVSLFGDTMTGRGVDQILPHPVAAGLHESYVRDARDYVHLAEAVNGPILRPVEFDYIWGDALPELRQIPRNVIVANIETSITTSEAFWPGKGVHYRMHPQNIACLTAAGIGCCCLANNHVMDWGYEGLEETLQVLERTGFATAGAGRNTTEAAAPAVCPVPGGDGRRIVVVATGSISSGIPAAWQAREGRAGVNVVAALSEEEARRIAGAIRRVLRPGDVSVVSIHWGGNWGYEVEREQVEFAHRLIDAGIDIVHGHSSHHVKGIEVYRGRLILYGCGDLINDYEGIGGHEAYRSELRLIYVARFAADGGGLVGVRLLPLRVRRMRLERANGDEVRWLCDMLTREGARFGTRAEADGSGGLALHWQ